MTSFKKYYLFSVIGVLIVSFYPLYMGVKVVSDIVRNGTVLAENYPKYIIPYTPISLAVIIAVLLLPALIKYMKKFALISASAISLGVFFASELLLESKVIVTSAVKTTLENWQMFMCYVPPEEYRTRTWRAIDVLIGDYSPAFKIHFYIISVVLILALINCFYGFAQMIITKINAEKSIGDSVSICCFVSRPLHFSLFYRIFQGRRNYCVCSLSGTYEYVLYSIWCDSRSIRRSFLLERKKLLSVLIPSIIASVVTFIMYLGEMIL